MLSHPVRRRHVIAHAAVEQVDVLAHQCNRAAQIAKLQLVNGDPIQQDRALVDGIQPSQQFHQRALAEPVAPTMPMV